MSLFFENKYTFTEGLNKSRVYIQPIIYDIKQKLLDINKFYKKENDYIALAYNLGDEAESFLKGNLYENIPENELKYYYYSERFAECLYHSMSGYNYNREEIYFNDHWYLLSEIDNRVYTENELNWINKKINSLENKFFQYGDKYCEDQLNYYNLRFIITAKLISLKENINLIQLLNPNCFNTVDLLGLLPQSYRNNFLEAYKTKDIYKIINIINDYYNHKLNQINELALTNKDKYLIVLDFTLERLKNKELNITEFHQIIDINNLPIEYNFINNSTTNPSKQQISGLEGYLINLQLDGIDQTNGIEFDSNRWAFIYQYIDEMRKLIIKF